MADQWNSGGEERELFHLLAKSALNDYPNPERIGCPGREFLRSLAFDRKSILIGDSRLDHVVHCSPCFRELTELRVAEKYRLNARRTGFAAVAAVLVVGIGLWVGGILTRHRLPTVTNTTPIVAQIDLQNRSITRGSPAASQVNEKIVVPKGPLKLIILLPFGSDAGTYEVQVLREVENPLIAGSGQAVILDGVTKLSVFLNTSSMPPGRYLLGIRQRPLDWVFNPITIQ